MGPEQTTKAFRIALTTSVIVIMIVMTWNIGVRIAFAPRTSTVEPGVSLDTLPTNSNTGKTPTPAKPPTQPKTVADGLSVPWAVVKADGVFLVTERAGSIRRITSGGTKKTYAVAEVAPRGEGGLMGMTLHPSYPGVPKLYLCMTAKKGSETVNRVVRYRWTGNGPVMDKVIIDAIPGGIFHDGCTLAFGPDGMLYATLGEGGVTTRAQDTNILAGKILRVTADGDIPADNPFGNAVWSYGHRNPQGITWDDQGRMWATEHGRSGATSGMDELNLIVKGGNYGWPTIEGNQTHEGMITPVLNSGANETWAPSAIDWYKGKLYFTGLRGSALYEATPSADGTTATLRAHFKDDYGRLRAVNVIGDHLYVTTSNTDGRGVPRSGDDRLLEIDPRIFEAAP